MSSTSIPSRLPTVNPASLFEHYRGQYATALLVAAVAEFDLFGILAPGPLNFIQLQDRTGLAERPLHVLLTAVRAMGSVNRWPDGRYELTALAAEHLVAGGEFFVGDYFSLAAESPEVREMIQRLRTNRPKGADDAGAGFIFRAGLKSAMEESVAARHFTLALAGRAKNVAPILAANLPLPGVRRLVDVGGGTGIYSIALLRANPELRAVVWDRPEVLRIAGEFAAQSGVADRLELIPGDFFTDPFPAGADAVLFSNILHDWAVPECQRLLQRASAALPPGGRLLVHDVFLDDDLGGPLAAALYSANLFAVTEGRLYSVGEVRSWLTAMGLTPTGLCPTLIHAQVLTAVAAGAALGGGPR